MNTKISYCAVDGIVLLDKPKGVTSNSALQQVRRLFNAEKAGHTGSLDPIATGMLPICLGKATLLSGYLLHSDKTYIARACLGIKTDTGDSEGKEVARTDARVSAEALQSLIPQFTGNIMQVPPMYSALKREGRKLYELAREGVQVEREERPVVIHDLQLTGLEGNCFDFIVHCSKGTYVRTLAEDWAKAAGSHAHLIELRRTGIVPFRSEAMVSLDQISAEIARNPESPNCLLPVGTALANWQQWTVDFEDEFELSRGRVAKIPCEFARGLLAIANPRGELLGIASHDGSGALVPHRWLSRGPIDPHTGNA